MKKIYFIHCIAWFLLISIGCNNYHLADEENDTCPIIFPDYSEVTFPFNIAPPNFIIKEEGEAYQTEIGISGQESSFIIHSNKPTVTIPIKKWKQLTEKAMDKDIFFRISICRKGRWTRYADIHNTISKHPIDTYLAYRLLYPGYELWNEMGIYQRDLSSYEEKAIVENRNFDKQCVNCHTFNQQSPDDMMMHIRGPKGGTLIQHNGQIEKVNPKAEGFKYGPTYSSWHPSGKYIAFSTNMIQQSFHASGQKTVEVFDMGSDLMIYDVEKHLALTDSLVYGDSYMETFPTWSADAKELYFCRAQGFDKNTLPTSIRYDLCCVSFDANTQTFGVPEVIFQASKQGKSVSFPSVSPDGKYLIFTLSDYGNFSIWHSESDLYVMNLANNEVKKMENINSDDVESYHTWSSNGHWFVFSSKRMDGLWARPYFAFFNPETGESKKPFVLPQEKPLFYNHYTYTYNRPELLRKPVTNGYAFEEAILQQTIQAKKKP